MTRDSAGISVHTIHREGGRHHPPVPVFSEDSVPCRVTAHLADKAYTANGKPAPVLHAIAVLQVSQAKFLQGSGPGKSLDARMCQYSKAVVRPRNVQPGSPLRTVTSRVSRQTHRHRAGELSAGVCQSRDGGQVRAAHLTCT
ncbi:hypothetical protein Baya_15082 [Bagarius yarrelli]|uniref:Uncharacterized protein n=1 Tax=Bagarius yarrelli TaxID=175774 RepID=A0A556VBC2_BAGYA|nr:hypothetical protein Baya_15082 [Bagarius yarrelli]